MARVYLDHASTTPARPEAVAALADWAALPPGDPGRLHEEGRLVRDALEEPASDVAELLGTLPRQVVFTSGATEAINAAVWGACSAAPGAPVLSAAVEHSAVRDASARLAPLRDDRRGRHRPARSRRAPRTPACDRGRPPRSCTANGPTTRSAPSSRSTRSVALCRDFGVTVHVDAAAACGHVPTDLEALDADLVSVSAHKLGGVPGAGALMVRRGTASRRCSSAASRNGGGAAGSSRSPPLLAFGAAAAALSRDGGRRMAARRRHVPPPDRPTWSRRALSVDGVEVDRAHPPRRVACRTLSAWASPAWRPNRCSSASTAPAWPCTRAPPARRRRSSPRLCSRRWAPTPATRCASASAGRPPTRTRRRSPTRSTRRGRSARPTELTSSSDVVGDADAEGGRHRFADRHVGRVDLGRHDRTTRSPAGRPSGTRRTARRPARCRGPRWPGSGRSRGGPGSSWAPP